MSDKCWQFVGSDSLLDLDKIVSLHFRVLNWSISEISVDIVANLGGSTTICLYDTNDDSFCIKEELLEDYKAHVAQCLHKCLLVADRCYDPDMFLKSIKEYQNLGET